ncbi:4'-phosphopantetheinyl transferase family protein [Agromyces italicus]|uniref:4'-phosphopantetheinyl transferase family protein n=1 Tax=Agromyces italicus TaxID=279572 RepID=UPI0003B74F8A|nr:4'-phosphopantetheinyl transferase superfamily protein [Agromyces italicus]
MDAFADGEIVELPGGDVRVVSTARGRRGSPGPELLLRRLVAAGAGVPADDVELVPSCQTCGARHGRPTVGYPTTPSGAPWFVDAGAAGDLVVATAATRRRVGVGLELVSGGALEGVDEAALHASERAALAVLDPPERARARATLWARKSALLRAIGHTGFTEPATLALTLPGEDDGIGRIERTVPEFGPGWRGVRFHDLAVPGAAVASVAVLP